jgi:hypothetical protein
MMRCERARAWALLPHDAVALAVAPSGWWMGVLLDPQGKGTRDCRRQDLINAGERVGVEVRTHDCTWGWLRVWIGVRE